MPKANYLLLVVQEKIKSFLFRHQEVWERMPLSELQAITASGEVLEVEKGAVLFRQDSYVKGAYLLLSGLVRITNQTPQGQRQIIYLCAPGEWMGYRQVLTNEPSPVQAEAFSRASVLFIPAPEFKRLLREQPHFSHNLLEVLSHEFSVWVNRLTTFTRLPVRERVAVTLLILHDRFSRVTDYPPNTILFPRADLADFVGQPSKQLFVR